MCGRYALHSLIDDLREHFGLFEDVTFSPSFNIAPSQPVPVVRAGPRGRELSLCQWGLIPAWSKVLPKTRPINARAETVATKPFFRAAYRHRRCLVPANGFYEWRREGSVRQPFFIRIKESPIMAFAGLWERWEHAENPVETCTILTTAANEQMQAIHDRMPVILHPDTYGDWLAAPDERLLVPFAGRLDAWPVSRRVNSPANNDSRLIEPPGAN